MIDNGSKSWTVFSWRPEGATDWNVVATRWTDSGPGDEKLIGTYPTESQACATATASQREYDRLRNLMLESTREANQK